MKIAGMQKLTLLDYPGQVDCTIFTQGCNFCCPFCHNSELIPAQGESVSSPDEVLAFLHKRRQVLDACCISGGEPLLQPDLPEWIREIRRFGYLVKLDTNGSLPQRLIALVEAGLVDYVAMDIKQSQEKYAPLIGLPAYDCRPIVESAAYLLQANIEYEFRTTVVAEYHQQEDFLAIGRWLGGAMHYYLQSFRPAATVVQPDLHAPSSQQMAQFLAVLQPLIPSAKIRGE